MNLSLGRAIGRTRVLGSVVRRQTDGGMAHSVDGWWMLISMIAFSIVLLWFAWALLRRPKPDDSLQAEVLTQRYARGEIDDEEFRSAARGLDRSEH